ncbi:MAG: DUF1501 domain-containing protein [Acidobacteria bacterium]|nr:DUF1501 domain-containing protein [Acidobacteriota bacterium]MBI3279017.1 DUF1501 domain-containing protein [Acidobacteriota bacterium]
MEKKVSDVLPARREVLKLGGYGLLGAFADQALWPVQARAAGRSNPRGTARFCVLIELAGAISHIDTFDFKEGEGTPKDLDVAQVRNELYLSRRLFPELSLEMDKVAIVRSLKSHEVVHFRGQYYTQAGRPLNPVQAPEIPSVGSVVSHEFEAARRETDTFPTYVGCNLDTSGCGALSTGFLHPRHSVLDIDLRTGGGATALDGEALKLLEERYRLLGALDQVMAPQRSGRDRRFGSFGSFQESAYRILGDPRWPGVFQMTAAEKQRYGDNQVGLGCLLARNLVRADAGTRYIHIVHPDWDHHKAIFDPKAKSNHYIRCNEVDRAMASLLGDLAGAASPRQPGKTLLDETLVVVATEFGRVPGPLNGVAGRHHYNQCYLALFAGGSVKGGRIIGRTDAAGEKVIEAGWTHKMQPKTENVYASIYSALGIDWRKEITNTPSRRAYRYVDVLGATEPVMDDEIADLFV